MSCENSDASYHIRNAKPAATEHAMRQFEDHLNDADPGSARIQSFLDYVDYVQFGFLAREHASDSKVGRQFSLIKTIIRQRATDIPGYKTYMKAHERLAQQLGEALDNDYSDGKEVPDIVESLTILAVRQLDPCNRKYGGHERAHGSKSKR